MKDSKFGRRSFLKRVGLAAPVILSNPAAFGMSKIPAQSTLHLVKPPRLHVGDTVGIVAPASPAEDPEDIDMCAAGLTKLGFKTKLSSNIRKRLGFLAGTDQARADDLMTMFGDPEIRGIFCFRGGYGSGRLLQMLDYRFIRKHAKIFIGFSDITALHTAFETHARMVSFHGPTLNSSITSARPSKFTLASMMKTILEPSAPGSIRGDLPQSSVTILKRGTATGPLIGGNLSVFIALIGTPFQPKFKGSILFFEDVDEAPYRFDGRLTQLLNAGLLQQVAGIAVGNNKNCTDPGAAKAKGFQQSVEDVLKDRLLPLGVPIVSGLPFGHVRENATIPMGVQATLDAVNGDLIINEAAVV
ncbi:MAG TPA: LD-carboxypeptidase [Verrucomicrobiae bacterium]|nr:LD-carboxypeptidase [Verrucomicrobiae bacterium]